MDRCAALGAIESSRLLGVRVRLCHLMSQVALRAGKNHRCFGLVDHPPNMPRDFAVSKSAAIEVTDATRMAASSPLRLLNCSQAAAPPDLPPGGVFHWPNFKLRVA